MLENLFKKNYFHVVVTKKVDIISYVDLTMNYEAQLPRKIRLYLHEHMQTNSVIKNFLILDSENFKNIIVSGPAAANVKIKYSWRRAQLDNVVPKVKKFKNISYSFQPGMEKKLIVTFNDWNLNNSVVSNHQLLTDVAANANVLHLYDNNFVEGTFFHIDEMGNPMWENAKEAIANQINKLQIDEKSVMFLGVGKGASLAINFGKEFPSSKILAVDPIMKITDYWMSTNLFSNYNYHTTKFYFQNYEQIMNFNLKNDLETILKNNQQHQIIRYEIHTYAHSYLLPNHNVYTVERRDIENMYPVHSRIFNMDEYEQFKTDLSKVYVAKAQDQIKKFLTDAQSYGTEKTAINTVSESARKKFMHVDFEFENTNGMARDIISYLYIYVDNEYFCELELPVYAIDKLPTTFGTGALGEFYNVILPEGKEVQVIVSTNSISPKFFKVKYTARPKYSPQEISDDIKVDNKHGVNIHYKERYQFDATKLMFTFPSTFTHYRSPQYRPTLLPSVELDNTRIIGFSDKYFVEGTYMAVDNNGVSLDEKYVMFMKAKMAEYNIAEEDVILWGASKGGGIAGRFAKYFPKAKFILIVPIMSMEIFRTARGINGNLVRYIDQYIDWRNDLDLLDELPKLNNKSLVIHSSIDPEVNLNSFLTEKEKYNAYYAALPHGEVARGSLPFWTSLSKEPLPVTLEIKEVNIANSKIDIEDSYKFFDEEINKVEQAYITFKKHSTAIETTFPISIEITKDGQTKFTNTESEGIQVMDYPKFIDATQNYQVIIRALTADQVYEFKGEF